MTKTGKQPIAYRRAQVRLEKDSFPKLCHSVRISTATEQRQYRIGKPPTVCVDPLQDDKDWETPRRIESGTTATGEAFFSQSSRNGDYRQRPRAPKYA